MGDLVSGGVSACGQFGENKEVYRPSHP